MTLSVRVAAPASSSDQALELVVLITQTIQLGRISSRKREPAEVATVELKEDGLVAVNLAALLQSLEVLLRLPKDFERLLLMTRLHRSEADEQAEIRSHLRSPPSSLPRRPRDEVSDLHEIGRFRVDVQGHLDEAVQGAETGPSLQTGREALDERLVAGVISDHERAVRLAICMKPRYERVEASEDLLVREFQNAATTKRRLMNRDPEGARGPPEGPRAPLRAPGRPSSLGDEHHAPQQVGEGSPLGGGQRAEQPVLLVPDHIHRARQPGQTTGQRHECHRCPTDQHPGIACRLRIGADRSNLKADRAFLQQPPHRDCRHHGCEHERPGNPLSDCSSRRRKQQ